jgi:hypothetical protein
VLQLIDGLSKFAFVATYWFPKEKLSHVQGGWPENMNYTMSLK